MKTHLEPLAREAMLILVPKVLCGNHGKALRRMLGVDYGIVARLALKSPLVDLQSAKARAALLNVAAAAAFAYVLPRCEHVEVQGWRSAVSDCLHRAGLSACQWLERRLAGRLRRSPFLALQIGVQGRLRLLRSQPSEMRLLTAEQCDAAFGS